MAEFEFAGITFRGGKIFILLTALSTLGGTSWAAFEFYKDYMDMKEVVANIDVSAIEARNNIIETKLDEAIDYTRDIKSDLRGDIMRVESQADRVESMVRDSQDKVRSMIDNADERYENRRDSLVRDTDAKIKEVEDTLNEKIQLVLDNPLS